MSHEVLKNETYELEAIWNDDKLFDQLAREAVQDALREHKRKGESIVVWQDGKVVTLTADEIPDFPVPPAAFDKQTN